MKTWKVKELVQANMKKIKEFVKVKDGKVKAFLKIMKKQRI